MREFSYPVWLKRVHNTTRYVAVLPDFENQELYISGDPFSEIRRWIIKHTLQTKIWPLPSYDRTYKEPIVSEAGVMIFVSMHRVKKVWEHE